MPARTVADTVHSPGTGRLRFVLIFSLASCAIGIWYAVQWGRPEDGMRGGALAVAATFAMLFLGRDTAARNLAVTSKYPSTLSELEDDITAEAVAYAALAPEARDRSDLVKHWLYLTERRFTRSGTSGAEAEAEDRRAGEIENRVRGVIGADEVATMERDARLALLEERVGQNAGSLRALLGWQKKETWYLAVSSVAGTVFAGFGDVIARWFGAT